ncbi:hypothetical protein LCGC14_2806370 [marine sediment metagenome]|uniref:Phosphoadenosine phosphosulphate reductase domain-containing protein n=1 Tax=marine sediment metagenome TaxID=412755 RepID=A0A0F9BCI9_9ZZZZ
MGITQVDMLSGLNKVDTAIALIQAFEPHQLGYYLAFSGGKDSVVIHHLAGRASGKAYKREFANSDELWDWFLYER